MELRTRKGINRTLSKLMKPPSAPAEQPTRFLKSRLHGLYKQLYGLLGSAFASQPRLLLQIQSSAPRGGPDVRL